MTMDRRSAWGVVLVCAAMACQAPPPPPPSVSTAVSGDGEAPPKSMKLWPRAELNRLAARAYLPLFWRSDDDGNGAVEPAEVAFLWGMGDGARSDYVSDDSFTLEFMRAVARMKEVETPPAGSDPESKRRALVFQELDQGNPTLIYSDFSDASEQDRAIVTHILAAAKKIERVHMKQIGSWSLLDQVPADDSASASLFHRNKGPWCVAPATEQNPLCSAIPGSPKKISGLYPAKLQEKEGFCESLKNEPNAERLRHPFHVVVEKGGKLEAVPYSEHYRDDLVPISKDLEAAAAAITSPDEAAFKKYLLAAAQAFLDNNWEPADEAWAAMNVHNSKWYLRIGPDEVYFEPCSLKAGFHVSFARINQDSLSWQNKLGPVKQEMEQAIATLAGKPYKAREVSFHLPDFIDIVLNAGDSRPPHGATIGQSLPNWGPVANEGRGRTVAMTNLYTDPDSRKTLEGQAASMLCRATMADFTSDPAPQVMGTVLHEAAHNLGPAHEYKVNGKKASEIFEGPLASMLEELKAQTAALYYTDWLVAKKLIDADTAKKAHVRDITWAFGHISRGMYDSQGRPRPYSQLAAIQVLFLIDDGAISWKTDETAANGKDQGCMELHLDKFPASVEKLMKDVAGIKGRGDKKRALELVKTYVDVTGDDKQLLDTIKERWLRAPKATFVYSIDM